MKFPYSDTGRFNDRGVKARVVNLHKDYSTMSHLSVEIPWSEYDSWKLISLKKYLISIEILNFSEFSREVAPTKLARNSINISHLKSIIALPLPWSAPKQSLRIVCEVKAQNKNIAQYAERKSTKINIWGTLFPDFRFRTCKREKLKLNFKKI